MQASSPLAAYSCIERGYVRGYRFFRVNPWWPYAVRITFSHVPRARDFSTGTSSHPEVASFVCLQKVGLGIFFLFSFVRCSSLRKFSRELQNAPLSWPTWALQLTTNTTPRPSIKRTSMIQAGGGLIKWLGQTGVRRRFGKFVKKIQKFKFKFKHAF